jgi:hypothetical protein
MSSLQGELTDVGATAREELARVREEMAVLDEQRTRLHHALLGVDESWSGSNLGYHADLYYGDFQRPPLAARFNPEWGAYNGLPAGWNDRDLAEVRAAIEQLTGVPINRYTTAVAIVAAPIRQLKASTARRSCSTASRASSWNRRSQPRCRRA